MRALSAIFATFVPDAYQGESRRHAELAATALSEVAEPADLRQLRLVLNLLEAPVGLHRVTGRRAFSKMPPDERERLLNNWAMSSIPQRRTFFHTVKRLAAFFAFADPGDNGVNPRWAAISYSVPEHPFPPRNAVDGAIVALAAGTDAVELSAEVVIVGSGAGGGVVAARLAELGHDVLVLEAGPYVPESEMPTDELTAFDRLYLDHGMSSTADLGLPILAGAALGGGTLVNWMTCIDPPANVRADWAGLHGLEGFDGRPTDDDLARLRTELGFELPGTIGPKDQAILDGAAALGWQATQIQRNAVPCGDCGSCAFGCRRGAKRSGPRLHLAAAAELGARFLPNARVERVMGTDLRTKRVVGRLASGRQFDLVARRVVVAAGALRTPLVLMRSGLAHPAIGANLHLHPTVVVAGRFDQRVAMWSDTMQGASSTQFLSNGFLVESAPGHPGLIGLAFPWASATQFASLMDDVANYAPLIGIVKDDGSGRVTLSRSGRARISYRISGRDVQSGRAALAHMAQLTRAAGAQRVVALGTPAAWYDDVRRDDDAAWRAYLDRLARFDFTPNRVSAFSAHQMGTARAGRDPRTSATDPWGRVRGARDLYVADTSLFPTALGVNPMVTAMALAARVARTIHDDATGR